MQLMMKPYAEKSHVQRTVLRLVAASAIFTDQLEYSLL